VKAVRAVLNEAIAIGGTTLRDFVREDGSPGYFVSDLQVYGRGGDTCSVCGSVLKAIRLGQRATVYCPKCQR
jgi:formamidopyrimidine-DNA glycosylase